MFRWFFARRALRRMNRPSYSLARGAFRGLDGNGFMSHLRHERFFNTADSQAERRRVQRLRLRILFGTLGLVALVWIVFESIRALQMF